MQKEKWDGGEATFVHEMHGDEWTVVSYWSLHKILHIIHQSSFLSINFLFAFFKTKNIPSYNASAAAAVTDQRSSDHDVWFGPLVIFNIDSNLFVSQSANLTIASFILYNVDSVRRYKRE